MLCLKACLALLLARVNGIELMEPDAPPKYGGGMSSARVRGSVESVESFNERIRELDAMTNDEYAEYHGFANGHSYEPCPEERTRRIPFTISTIEGVHDDETGQLRWNDDSWRTSKDVYFLTDVTYCEESDDDYVLTGTKVSSDEFKMAVAEHIASNGLDSVQYNVHGVTVSPKVAFEFHGWKFKTLYQDVTKRLFIPIMWYAFPWYAGMLRWVRAGNLLAANADVFVAMADYPTYIMTHSMGNWIFQVMAMALDEAGSSEILFEKHFMVAACVPKFKSLFSAEENPDAPRTQEEELKQDHIELVSLGDEYDSDGTEDNQPNSGYRLLPCLFGAVGCDEYDSDGTEDGQPNSGYRITKLSKEVRVLWNSMDGFFGWSDFLPERCIVSDEAEQRMNLEYFRNKVSFSEDMAPKVSAVHGYYKEPAAVEEYDPQFVAECELTPCVGADICEPPSVKEHEEDYSCGVFYVRNNCCVFSHKGDKIKQFLRVLPQRG